MLRRRVLFICRDPALMLELHTHFSPRTYEVFATPDYSATIRQVYELQPDVVLLVAQDARHDGWFASLTGLRGLSRVPIVTLIGTGNDADRVRAEAHGATACFLPPFNGPHIAGLVGTLMRVRDAETVGDKQLG